MTDSSLILLVEDDHDIRVSLKQSLEDCGYIVESVANGWEAITLLGKNSSPRLIILDLSMPIMNGEEFLRLKEENPKFSNIPILIVSSHQHRIDLLRKYPSIKKPVDLEEFARKVASCLKLSEK